MNQDRVTWLRARLLLYEEKRQAALYKRHYDDAIETYKGEIMREFKDG